MKKLGLILALLISCSLGTLLAGTVSAQILDDLLEKKSSVISAQNTVEPVGQPNAEIPSKLSTPIIAPAEVITPDDNLLSDDLTPMSMYRQAHPIVKGVILGLFLASIATWTVLIAKGFQLWAAKRKLKKVLIDITNANSLDSLVQVIKDKKSIGAYMVHMAEREVKVSLGALDEAGAEGLRERLYSLLNRIEVHAIRHISSGTAIVATIGSIGPFVGLFGTVWGIMNSFVGIANSKTTNLAVVAPGIAEALLATAIGLAAAIPAVIIYNILVRWIGGYRQVLVDCSVGIERLVSRDLDFRNVNKVHQVVGNNIRPTQIAVE